MVIESTLTNDQTALLLVENGELLVGTLTGNQYSFKRAGDSIFEVKFKANQAKNRLIVPLSSIIAPLGKVLAGETPDSVRLDKAEAIFNSTSGTIKEKLSAAYEELI